MKIQKRTAKKKKQEATDQYFVKYDFINIQPSRILDYKNGVVWRERNKRIAILENPKFEDGYTLLFSKIDAAVAKDMREKGIVTTSCISHRDKLVNTLLAVKGDALDKLVVLRLRQVDEKKKLELLKMAMTGKTTDEELFEFAGTYVWDGEKDKI